MLIEYDLVIIGATELGCQMALRARALGARVAIVEQGERPDGAIGFRQWVSHTTDDQTGAELAKILLEDELSTWSPESLQLQGIDYLAGSGSWVQQPKSGFQVQERLLRSSNFVAALTPKRRLPIALWKIPCRFPEEFPGEFLTVSPLPDRVAIVGEAIVGIELAMALNRRGVQVILIVPTPQILPQMPREGAFRIQVVLEAAGIQVLPQTRLRSAENLRDKIQLQLGDQNGDRNLEVDQVILATAFERLEPERLGLRSLKDPALRKLRLVGSGKRSKSESFDGLTSNAGAIALTEVQSILMPWKWFRSKAVGRLINPQTVWIGQPVMGEMDQMNDIRPEDRYTLTGKLENGGLWYCLRLTEKGQLLSAVLVGDLAMEFGPLLGMMAQKQRPIGDLLTLPMGEPKQTKVIQQWLKEWESRSQPSLRHQLFLDGLAFRRRRSA